MKRILSLLLCCMLLSGCVAPQKTDSVDRLLVVTTIFPVYDFVRAVGGDDVEVKMLISPGSEVHSFDPAPSDIKAVYDSDLFFCIGGESETWVDSIIGDTDAECVKLIESVDTLCEHEHDSHSHAHDEHIWTSTENAKKMLYSVSEAICAADAKNANTFKERCQNYIEEIDSASKKIKSVVESSQSKFILVADRFPFVYFTEQFGIDYEAALDGCAVSTDISLKGMKMLVDTVKSRNITSVFCTELSNRRIAEALAEQTGVSVMELHSAHNVTLEDFENGVRYVDILLRNAAALEEGMK